MSRTARLGLLTLLLTCLFLIWSVRSGRLTIAPAWDPRIPLQVADPPTLLTGWKLRRASADGDRCRQALAGAGMTLEPLPDRQTGAGCGFTDAVLVRRSSVDLGEPVSLSCRAALSLAMWERHVLQPQAQAHLGQPVVAIDHFGSYACRNIYGRADARRSGHATADAFDVAGFRLADGRRVRVLRDWPDTDPAGRSDAGNFLRAVFTGACRWFDGALGPEYNQAHADHFHLERGGFRGCR